MNEQTNDNNISATPEPSPSPESEPRHSHRHMRHANREAQRRRSQRMMLAIALAVAVLLLIFVSIFSMIRIGSLSNANDSMNAELFQVRQELAKLKPELEQARKELGNLTRGRFPYLRDLVQDKVLPVDNSYVKNIVFTSLRTAGGTRYEYRLVLENKTDVLIRPDVRVFVFDHRGVQVGMGEVTDRSDMIPGESRSYSSTIERFMDEEPRYFYVWTRSKNKSDTSK